MLYLVPTPIGNLGDITLRALEVLKSADVIAAEDTRHSGLLLKHFGIRKPLLSYHEHNEAQRTAELMERLGRGEVVAVVSDAGMPGISDPGARIVAACREAGVPLTILPGPSALLTAVVGSGFPAERFYYGGFLPPKSGGRARELTAANGRQETSVFFESPHRLLKTLEAAAALLGERPLAVARELSKTFEEYRIGPARELLAHYTAHPPRGEIVLLIRGHDDREWRRLIRERDKNAR
ncbi:MAG TPA: 16S rRNA (cytidine(1402)-2'-O)-methyltransferase [Chthoniobacteraceae bacterium]|nr:16S rRNA (cytidine(1402)-2'-O)-methyltransferase [Chthoniobacteraceae bacterium]